MEITTVLTRANMKNNGWVEYETTHPEIRKVATQQSDIIADVMPLVGTGQPVVIEAGEPANPIWKDRNGFTHPNPHYLNAIRPFYGAEMASEPFAQTLNTQPPAPTGWPQQQPLPETAAAMQVPAPQADDRGPVMGRNNIAAAVAPTLIQLSDKAPETIQAILDGLARWSESGGPVFGLPPHPSNVSSY
jgi:hypothetical protein